MPLQCAMMIAHAQAAAMAIYRRTNSTVVEHSSRCAPYDERVTNIPGGRKNIIYTRVLHDNQNKKLFNDVDLLLAKATMVVLLMELLN